MCGRFARYQPLSEWVAALGAAPEPGAADALVRRDAGPRYNIAPGTQAWIAMMDADGALGFDERKWTFPTPRGNRINVRSETAHRVPEYREHYDHHRCVVLANGFYEPKGPKTEKNRPWFYFQPCNGEPLFLGAIAGAEGFSILTRAPVPPVAAVHDRSPVLVPPEHVIAWLDPDIPGATALRSFAPASVGTSLDGWHVGDGAKRVTNEGPQLIAAQD